jgi:hypothetical protein
MNTDLTLLTSESEKSQTLPDQLPSEFLQPPTKEIVKEVCPDKSERKVRTKNEYEK